MAVKQEAKNWLENMYINGRDIFIPAAFVTNGLISLLENKPLEAVMSVALGSGISLFNRAIDWTLDHGPVQFPEKFKKEAFLPLKIIRGLGLMSMSSMMFFAAAVKIHDHLSR